MQKQLDFDSFTSKAFHDGIEIMGIFDQEESHESELDFGHEVFGIYDTPYDDEYPGFGL